jgi:hypothetical protein
MRPPGIPSIARLFLKWANPLPADGWKVLIFSFLFLAGSLPASYAGPGESSVRVSILSSHLDRLSLPSEEGGFSDLHSFLISLLSELHGKTEFCLENNHCLNYDFSELARAAYRSGAIDRIIRSNLLRILPAIEVQEGAILIHAERVQPEKKRKERVMCPDLTGYLRVKQVLKDSRLELNGTAEIPQEIRSWIDEAYPRKIGFGSRRFRVGFEEYMLARFSRIQINRMSEMLERMMQTVMGSLKVVIETKSGEQLEEGLTAPEAYRYAMNRLDATIELEKGQGLLRGQEIRYGDLIMAGVLTGSLKIGMIQDVISMEEFREPRNVALKHWGGLLLNVVRTVGYLNPYTAPIVILGSVVQESIRAEKEYHRAASRRAQTIRR